MVGICRRGPRWLAGSGASRSTHVMSPTATLGYEWGSPPPHEPERDACKLPTPSFPASGRAGTASVAAARGRSPWQGPATEEPCEGKLSCTVLKASGGPRGPSLSQLRGLSRRQFVVGAGAVGVLAAGLSLVGGCAQPASTSTPARVVRVGFLGPPSA